MAYNETDYRRVVLRCVKKAEYRGRTAYPGDIAFTTAREWDCDQRFVAVTLHAVLFASERTHWVEHGSRAVAQPEPAAPRPAHSHLPATAKARKEVPLATFMMTYFPDAFIDLARCSYIANEQHNPGEPMHWAREKSVDHLDCLMRHMMDAGQVDGDGILHDTKVAWRALANLQLTIERMRAAGSY
jgi:hypothetical protein